MLSKMRGGSRLSLFALSVGLAVSLTLSSAALAGDDGGDHHGDGETSFGSLGWAPEGVYPGFYGFSLRWHLGYGYGLYALGVGADGGYPVYGGPGYPHEPPQLNRCGPESPYLYFGGPDDIRSDDSNFFSEVGGLVLDGPVVSVGEPGDFGYVDIRGDVAPHHGFGQFTGAVPYPETKFAPYFSAPSAAGSAYPEGTGRPGPKPPSPAGALPDVNRGSPSASLSPATHEATKLRATARTLGIDEEPAIDSIGTRGMKVTRVFPGSSAERAGLHVGDFILSINGYLTTERGNVAWIVAVAAPNDLLKIKARSTSEGKLHELLAELPAAAVNTERPSFLPVVGSGPPPATR